MQGIYYTFHLWWCILLAVQSNGTRVWVCPLGVSWVPICMPQMLWIHELGVKVKITEGGSNVSTSSSRSISRNQRPAAIVNLQCLFWPQYSCQKLALECLKLVMLKWSSFLQVSSWFYFQSCYSLLGRFLGFCGGKRRDSSITSQPCYPLKLG